MLQLLSTKNFTTLNKLLETIQAYTKKEDFVVIRKQSKSDFKSYNIVEIALNCDRDNKIQYN